MPQLLSLNAPVGDSLENRPDDVAATDQALRAIGAREDDDLDESFGQSVGLLNPALSRSIEKHQEADRLRVDGRLNPGGPTEQTINNRLLRKPPGAGLLGAPAIRLAGSVGNDRENRSDDVVTVKKTLGGLGLMAEDPFDRPHSFIDAPTTAGIRAFQRAKKLKEDGTLDPGGETEAALRNALGNLAHTFGPEWRAFHKRKAEVEQQGFQSADLRDELGGDEGFTLAQALVRPMPRPRMFLRPNPPGHDPLAELPSDPSATGVPTPEDQGEALGKDIGRIIGGLLAPGRKVDERTNTAHGQPKTDPRPLTGPDPENARRKPGDTRHTSPPPKLPNKTVLPQREPPGLRDAIEIFPDHSDLNKMPIWVEFNPHGRKGSPSVQSVTEEAGDRGRNGFGKSFSDMTEGKFEKHVRNRKTANDRPRTTKGDSYIDYMFVVHHPNGKVRVVIDTYTALKNRNPDARERRQFEKLFYNEENQTVYVRLPKPPKGREINWDRYDRYMEALGKRIKSGLDSGNLDLSNRTNAERFFKNFKP